MKFKILIFFILLSILSKSQSIDSTWVEKNLISKYTTDTITFLPAVTFTSDKGKSLILSDFKGKILYVSLWSTSCAPCIAQFPHQEQLFNRLEKNHLDTSVIFININMQDTKTEWKKALTKYHPIGINLHSSDTSFYDKWGINTIPCHILISRSGYLLGKYILQPSDGGIDWLLYATVKGINPIEAIWREFSQNKLMEKNKSSLVFTDKEFDKWFKDFLPSLLEYNSWKKIHQTFNNR